VSAALHFDHVSLRVPNLDASLAFYRDLLGAHEIFRLDAPRLVILQSGRVQIEIEEDFRTPVHERPRAPLLRGGVNHIGFRVRRLQAALDRARHGGHPVIAEPYELTPGIRQAVIVDPAGIEVQFTELDLWTIARSRLAVWWSRRVLPAKRGPS
jgi:lactoylglutathione lyase